VARTPGIALLERLNDGRLEVTPSEFLTKTREEVSIAIEELLEVGARIRPLFVDKRRVGWIRGVHLSERKALKRWITNEVEFIEHLLGLATTLTPEEIRDLNLIELRSLSRVVKAMSDSDLKLYSYISAFVTTSHSEQLWYSQGTAITSFPERWVTLPDGKRIRIISPSEQARLWATLCNYRVQAKQRLEASMNAVLTIRPLVGKGADPIANDLKAISRSLQTDTLEPWRDLVHFKEAPKLDDGWAHSGDDSVEGVLRELSGMMANDRHERVYAAFDEQIRKRAEKQKRVIEERISMRGGDVYETSFVPMTQAELDARSTCLRQGRPITIPAAVSEDEPQSSPMDRLAKYR
jgi:hypothetical protein